MNKLNASVQRNTDRYYDTQIDSTEYGSELRKMINDINTLTHYVREQDIRLRGIIYPTLSKMSSKRITTGVNWYSNNEEYSNGQLVLYRGGIGYIPTYGTNTVQVGNMYDLLYVLNEYGYKLEKLVPTKEKQEVLNIIVKYAKIGFKPVNHFNFTNHKCSNKTVVLDTDLSDNHSFCTEQIKCIQLTNSAFSPTTIWLDLNNDDNYSSDKIYLSRKQNAKQIYKVAINWKTIKDDMIKTKNILAKAKASRDHIIKELTNELSPYLLANKI